MTRVDRYICDNCKKEMAPKDTWNVKIAKRLQRAASTDIDLCQRCITQRKLPITLASNLPLATKRYEVKETDKESKLQEA